MSWWKRLVDKVRGVYGSPATPASEGSCEHGDAIHLSQGTAEFEWFVARGELEMSRDLRHQATARPIEASPIPGIWYGLGRRGQPGWCYVRSGKEAACQSGME
jgi:hypothetical protein